MYDLFLDRHGLALPLTDEEHHSIDLTENAESNMLLTEKSLRKIQAGQFMSIRNLPFQFKFSVAMRSIGWPADALVNFLQPCEASQLATAQDSQARTALHWAAKHFGYWACALLARDQCPYDTKAKGYAELATKLLKMGSNAHAVNALHEAPFMTMLHSFAAYEHWSLCADGVRRWGELLVESGLDLNAYVHAENPVLQRLAEKRRVWDGETYYLLSAAEIQLTILNGSTLAVQIKFCRLSHIWEQCVPPGAWEGDSRLPTRSIGIPPQVSDDEQIYWRKAKTTRIYSRRYLIQATYEADRPFYSSHDFEMNWRALFEGFQDDHGMVATTISRGRSRKQIESSNSTARALSVPPEMTQPIYNELPTFQYYGLNLQMSSKHWMTWVYRCPVELRWKVAGGVPAFWGRIEIPRMVTDFESRDIKMRLDAEDDWEVQLLREQGDRDVVKRFAQRFCPELGCLVEQEQEYGRLVQSMS